MKDKMHFNSKTIHGGQEPDKAYGAVMPPIDPTRVVPVKRLDLCGRRIIQNKNRSK